MLIRKKLVAIGNCQIIFNCNSNFTHAPLILLKALVINKSVTNLCNFEDSDSLAILKILCVGYVILSITVVKSRHRDVMNASPNG